jgi:hypothetical protein
MSIETQQTTRAWANPFNPEQFGTPKAVQAALQEFGNIQISLGRSDQQGTNWINIDARAIDGVQVVHNLENRPWPLPDECASFMMAPLIIEHIDPANFGIFKFFDECWRVLQYEKPLMFSVPYGGGQMHWADPGHTVGFNENSFYHFDPLHTSGWYNTYRPLPWKLETTPTGKPIFAVNGLIECVMTKRRIDPSYGEKTYQ